MIASETSNSVTLRRQEGKEDVLLRTDIEAMAGSGQSLMPEGLEKDLPPQGLADLIAFGRPYISNPDLVARFAMSAPLNDDIKRETIYAAGPEGYVDYPEMK